MDSIRVSEALDPGSIPGATMKKPHNQKTMRLFYFEWWIYRPLIQHFLQFIFQIVAAQRFSDHFTLRIDQYVEGNTVEFERFHCLAAPELEVADLAPVQLVRPDRFLPGILFLVEGNTKDSEVFAFKLIVRLDHIGILRPAGATPAGPEIYQQVFAPKGGQGNGMTIDIGQGQIRSL